MWKFIILVIANFIIWKLFGINILKHLLFNPKINAAIVGLGIILNIIAAIVDRRNMWMIIPWIISILDCIQDVIWGENYYGSVEDHISPLYAVKCISSMLTRGLSRAVFLIFTSLCIPRIAQADVKAAFEGRVPMEVDPQYPYGSSFVANFFDRFYSQEFLRFADPYIKDTVLYVLGNLFEGQNVVRYSTILGDSYRCPYTDDQFVRRYCGEYKLHGSEIKSKIRNSLEEGNILTNEKFVDETAYQECRQKTLKTLSGEDLFACDISEGNILTNKEFADETVPFQAESLYTYIDKNYYQECRQKILKIFSARGALLACDIADQKEFAFLMVLMEKDAGFDRNWRKYFIMFMMQPFILEGNILTNEKCVDEEFRLRQVRLENTYPKKFLQKFMEKITEEGKKALAERDNAEKELSSEESLYTYIDSNFYKDCKEKMLEALSKKGIMALRSIVKLEELSFLNELQEKDYKLDQRWREYFIIFIMQSLVKDGMVQEGAVQVGVVQVGIDPKESCLTGILDTHQYSVVGGKGISYNSKEDHPDLADPELGECCG